MNYALVGEKEISQFAQSTHYRQAALQHLAHGVSSTPRASQLPVPIAIQKAEGVVLTDIDNNHYIDYTMGYGPLILGHSPPTVLAAVNAELQKGLRTASIHTGEAELAELIAQSVPSAELSCFLSSGTEAVQLALRIARAVTGKIPVIKFRANYHGWFDNIHVANNPGNDGPSTAGQDPHAADSFTIVDWGDIDAVKKVLTADFAAVLLEPVAINAGCFEAPAGFLQELRVLTKKLGVMLIFDEVITGFRLSLGGAQQCYQVMPDITVLGKALGAGLPISAVTGSRAAMQPVATGQVLHRGTFNGNPLSVAASIACLHYLRQNQAEIYPRMNALAADLKNHINTQAQLLNVPVCANQVGSAVQIFTGVRALSQLADLHTADKNLTLHFTAELLRFGVNALPRGLMYVSTAHDSAHIDATKKAIAHAMLGFQAYLTK